MTIIGFNMQHGLEDHKNGAGLLKNCPPGDRYIDTPITVKCLDTAGRGPAATYLCASGGQTFVYFSSPNFYHLLLHKLLFKLNRVISQALVCFKVIKVH